MCVCLQTDNQEDWGLNKSFFFKLSSMLCANQPVFHKFAHFSFRLDDLAQKADLTHFAQFPTQGRSGATSLAADAHANGCLSLTAMVSQCDRIGVESVFSATQRA